MKLHVVIGLLLSFPCAAQASTSYTDTGGASKAEAYGISYPETQGAGVGVITETRHHRFGQQTGIGGSTMQTTSATAEEMPTFSYRPTSISPAVVPGVSIPALNEEKSFSNRMESPAFQQTFTGFPALSPEPALGMGTLEHPLPSPSPGTGQIYKFFGHTPAKGKALERTLINPFTGL